MTRESNKDRRYWLILVLLLVLAIVLLGSIKTMGAPSPVPQQIQVVKAQDSDLQMWADLVAQVGFPIVSSLAQLFIIYKLLFKMMTTQSAICEILRVRSEGKD